MVQTGSGCPFHAAGSYRNVFGPCRPEDAFRGHGLEAPERTRVLLRALTATLNAVSERNSEPQGNPRLPAGYTYLAQLSMHDITHNVSSLPGDSRFRGPDVNLRRQPLRLDTLYGGGPNHQPLLYEQGRPPLFLRTRLRRGGISTLPGAVPQDGIGGDIPRATAPVGLSRGPDVGLTEAVIADPRNDDNGIIVQVSMLFATLHNRTVGLLSRWAEDGSLAPMTEVEVFEAARYVTETAFRRILRDDLLRRLLHPAAYDRHFGAAPAAPRDEPDDPRIPVEFSHAVMRAGHAMVRDHYIFNDDNIFGLTNVLTATARMNPAAMPLSAAWMIDWSYFFPLHPDGPINLSRRFSPHIAAPLTRDINLESNVAQRGGMLLRDFFRAEPGRMRSVASCIDHLDEDLRGRSRLLSDGQHRQAAMVTYLHQICEQAGTKAALDGADIAVLADDPPLLLFSLFESMHEAEGESLGILGSTIAAEVFRKGLAAADSAWQAGRDELEALADRIFGGPPPATMPDLLRILAAAGPPA